MSSSIDDISRIIEKISGNGKEQILSRTRTKELVFARMLVSYILRTEGFTFAKIGEILNRKHGVVMHYTKHFEFYKKYDKEFRNFVEMYEKEYSKEQEQVQQQEG